MKVLASSSYESQPYEAKAIPQAHPDRLAVVARFHGFLAAKANACRYLDVGCADGAHLIPLALEFPESTFVGVELSPSQAERAQRAISELGLTNVTVHCGDFTQVELGGGFDYVVAHGLYSWVPPEVQDALIRKTAEWLAPNGVGYLSYNVYPGSYVRDAVRSIGLEFSPPETDPKKALYGLRAISKAFAASIYSERPLGSAIAREFERVAGAADSQVCHDWFEANMQPVYFADFARHLARHDLRFLAEVTLPPGVAQISADGQKLLAQLAKDVIKREACVDVLTCNAFRCTLVARASALPPRRVDRGRVRVLMMSSVARIEGEPTLKEGAAVTFLGSHGERFQLSQGLAKAALFELIEQAPVMLGFELLVERARARLAAQGMPAPALEVAQQELEVAVFELHLMGCVDLREHSARCVLEPGERPLVSPWLRWLAMRSKWLVNASHVPVLIDDADVCRLIPLLDGSRDRQALLGAWRQALGGEAKAAMSLHRLTSTLKQLAKLGLLQVAPSEEPRSSPAE